MTGLQFSFDEFIRKHPEAYTLFEKFTYDVIHSGRKHFGAKAIIERVRWQTMFEEKGGAFKINNNYTAFLVRMFIYKNPWHKGFFQTRRAQADIQ